MKNENVNLEPNEDVFQKSLKGEAEFLRGLEKHHYKTIWSFSLAFLVGVSYIFVGLLLLFTLLASIENAVQQKAARFIVFGIVVFLISFMFILVGVRLLKKLASVFLKKNRRFKIGAILLLIGPIIFLVIFLFLFIRILASASFTI